MIKTLLYEQEVMTHFRRELRGAKEFAFASALVSSTGVAAIRESLQHCLAHGGVGKILIGIDLPTDPKALETLLAISQKHSGRLELKYFRPLKSQIFHPKLYVFKSRSGKSTAIIGSSNFTSGGLNKNYEANLWIQENGVVARLRDYFDEHFDGAYSSLVTSDWISSYREVWLLRKKAFDDLKKLRLLGRTMQRKHAGEAQMPKRIDGQRIAFTGRIIDWPRRSRLYPRVRRLGGEIVEVKGIANATCLVHAENMGGRKTTRKLKRARQFGVPVITEDDFLRLVDKSEARRKSSRN
jgi:HKD family nuclease